MLEIVAVNPTSPEPDRIARAAEFLRAGEAIAIPTDTIYGLAANPFDATAVEKVFQIKGRPKHNPLLLLVDSLQMALGLASNPPSAFRKLADRFWPGPLTIVVKASERLPDSVTAGTGTIGLRLPEAAIATALIRAAGFPITATSANLSGQADCTTAAQVEASLGTRTPLILDGGPSRIEKPSTVVSLVGKDWEIVREGAIPSSELAKFLD